MIIVMKSGVKRDELEKVLRTAHDLGLASQPLDLPDGRAVRLFGYSTRPRAGLFESLDGVAEVLPVSRPVHRVRRGNEKRNTVIHVGSTTIGDGRLTVIAGPCAVESEERLLPLARELRRAGADLLRGGAYKPRTSPYDFQGLGEEGLRLLARAREVTGLPVVTEAVDERSLELVEEYGDVIQIGARNMQNFALLKCAGRSQRPVFLKRGMSAGLEDLLLAAEYVMDQGNSRVMLCERGIRTFSDHSRFTLDLSIVPLLKRMSHLPVFVDPSHASGLSESVAPLARAAVAAGADGVMVEVHPEPQQALSDGPQSLLPAEFEALVSELRALEPMIRRQQETVR